MAGEEIPMMFYASWFKEEVAPKLTKEQKEKLLRKISDISLEKPIYIAGIEFDKSEFPELAPYAHTEKISGLQLYAVMTELFGELSKTKIPKPYPEWLTAKKKLKEVV
jgi:hypothetical protein